MSKKTAPKSPRRQPSTPNPVLILPSRQELERYENGKLSFVQDLFLEVRLLENPVAGLLYCNFWVERRRQGCTAAPRCPEALTKVDSEYLLDTAIAAAMDAIPTWPDLNAYQQGKMDAGGKIVLEGQLRRNPAARQRYRRFLEHERLFGRDATPRVVLPKK